MEGTLISKHPQYCEGNGPSSVSTLSTVEGMSLISKHPQYCGGNGPSSVSTLSTVEGMEPYQ